MATWQFIGLSSVVDVATNNITLTEPTGCQQGDLLVACIAFRSAAATGFTLPAGWTLVDEQVTNNVTSNTTSSVGSAHMAYIIRGASAPADLTWTRSSGANAAYGRIIAYRNVAQSAAKDTNVASTTATNTTSISVTGVTTGQTNDLVVAMIGSGRNTTMSAFNATTPGTSSGVTSSDLDNPLTTTWKERADSGTTTGARVALSIFDAVKSTVGATGNLTATAAAGGGHAVVAGAFKIVDTSAQGFAKVVTGYRLSNTASDLTGVGQNKAIVTSGATAGSWSGQSLGSGAIAYGSFFTPSGDPGVNGVSDKFVIVRLYVTAGNANLRYSAQAVRVNSAGTVQAIGPSSDETTAGTSQTYTLFVPTTGLGTWASGDRLEIRPRIQNRTTNVGQGTTITYATYSSVQAGWTGSISKFNYGDTADELVLSNSDLTVTRNPSTTGTGYNNLRATVGADSSAHVYYEATLTGIVANNAVAVGAANEDQLLNGIGNWLGNTTNGVGIFQSGDIYRNNAIVTTLPALSSGDRIAVELDRPNSQIRFRNVTANGSWSAWVTAPLSSTTGLIFPFVNLNDLNDASTINLGASVYSGAVPAGATNWDGTSMNSLVFKPGPYQHMMIR